ncbi:hypothetical protein KN1_09050 [Stygiolobus caldivivus]|uniref:Uncharacterized protein n=1 Tax=Stygiolobus caldivivus TaxID=2824673 RepID=A0A8D5U5V6_9CREN|nr:hypothetical protein KN1_09050 [Stygiolobus caldivivus]
MKEVKWFNKNNLPYSKVLFREACRHGTSWQLSGNHDKTNDKPPFLRLAKASLISVMV